MIIAILILAYLLWIGYVYDSLIKEEPTNLALSSALIVLLSWQVNLAWGIVMLCFSVLFILIKISK